MSYVTLSMDPARANATMRRDIERLLQDVVPTRTSPTWTPAVNGYEDATGFTMEFDVPGIAPEHLEITAQDGSLVVRGTRSAAEQKESRDLLAECPVGAFERRLRLPKTADIGNVSASYALGVLTVRVEKLATVAPRKVTINVAQPVATRATPAAEVRNADAPKADTSHTN
jgi:HSP20 family protein